MTIPGKFIEFDPDEKFWLVWGEATERVTKKQPHSTAMREASRLAKKNKGQRFYVMKTQYVFLNGDLLSEDKQITLDTPLSMREFLALPQETIDRLYQERQERLASENLEQE